MHLFCTVPGVARFALTPGYFLSLLRSDYKRRTHVRKSPIYLFVLAVALVAVAALASVSLVVSAQNSNSSTTMTNMGTMSTPKPKVRKKVARAMPRCDNTKQEQTDLSGTYTGKLKHGDGPTVDATLTINGNNFNGTMGSDTMSGRITAVTTCGYTAVTMMPQGAPQAMSLRAKKVGNSLTLTSVPGEPQMVTFTTGGAMKAKPRKHKAKPKSNPGTPPPSPTKPKM
jgi:hypothetical protein